MLFRLRCHFCGTRSDQPRGTTTFKCRSCEAHNFFDKQGYVVDPPARVAAAPQAPAPVNPTRAFAQPDPTPTFCQNCLSNQRIFAESLANYLPDEDHPQYYEFERRLPEYKADLERRYPQICKRCAPIAQATISKADRYGLQQNVAKNMRDTYARNGKTNTRQRDDWDKWSKRCVLGLLRCMVYISLLVQVAWHGYSLFLALHTTQVPASTETDSLDVDELALDPTLSQCGTWALGLRFFQPCERLLRLMVPTALKTSLALLWYSPGLALWYHHTIRVEAVHGQGQHFFMQIILLAIRAVAWLTLSSPTVTADFTKAQLLASHGFMVAFIPAIQRLSENAISYEAWRIRGNMTRSPDEVDMFGATAGPERDTSPPQASSIPPVRLFERNDKPFPIGNLAPRTTRSTTNHHLPYQAPLSPPDSPQLSNDGAENEMDWQPSTSHQYQQSQHQPNGWSSMRTELTGIASHQNAALSQQRAAQEAEQARLQAAAGRSPFHGTLPPDPPTLRRLRGTPAREVVRQVPVTDQPDFYDRMSQSFGSERFGLPPAGSKIGTLARPGAERRGAKGVRFSTAASDSTVGSGIGSMGLGLNDEDDDFSPMKHNRASGAAGSGSGSLQMREGQWQLLDKTPALGIEDLFGGNAFRIADEPGTVAHPSGAVRSGEGVERPFGVGLFVLVAVVAVVVGCSVDGVRRPVCLWAAGVLEEWGY